MPALTISRAGGVQGGFRDGERRRCGGSAGVGWGGRGSQTEKHSGASVRRM